MRSGKSNFTADRKKVSVEGFNIDKLLTAFVKEGIKIKNLRFITDLEVVFTITREDLAKLYRIAKSNYKITVIHSKGYIPLWYNIRRRKATIVGIALAIGVLYFQSLFVTQIDVSGYVKYTEQEVREVLRESGLYEGCPKNMDLGEVKNKIYEKAPGIAWVGLEFTGRRADVKVVEGNRQPPKTVDDKKPANIVADVSGYIYDVRPKVGLRAVEKNQFVKKGDVLITGTVPLTSTTFEEGDKEDLKYYVHAAGEVRAKVPYRYVFYAASKKQIKEKTGKRIFGINLSVGDYNVNTAKKRNPYKRSTVEYKNIVNIKKPFPIKISLTKVSEVKVTNQKKSKKELEKEANIQIRKILREKLPQKSQILNKSLNFTREKNIMKIGVTLEVLQQIGKEKEIVLGKDKLKKSQSQGNSP